MFSLTGKDFESQLIQCVGEGVGEQALFYPVDGSIPWNILFSGYLSIPLTIEMHAPVTQPSHFEKCTT